MRYFRIKNWEKYQHRDVIRSRSMPWCKLYSHILSDYEFNKLPSELRLCFVMMMALACANSNEFGWDEADLRRRFNLKRRPALDRLASIGLIEEIQPKSIAAMPAERQQSARSIRQEEMRTPAAAGPVGSPGRPTGYHGVDSNGWKISDREQQIIERAELAKREEDLEEPVFAPVYVEPEPHEATWVDPDLVQAMKPLNDSMKFLAQQAYVEEQKRQARKILEGSGGSLGLPTGPAPAKAGGPN